MRVDLPVCPSPSECYSHDGSVVAVLLEVTLSLIPGSFLKEDRAAFTVTHKKLQSAKHTFSPDKDWMMNFGHLCSILLASVREHAGAACPWAGPAQGTEQGQSWGDLCHCSRCSSSAQQGTTASLSLICCTRSISICGDAVHQTCFARLQKLWWPILGLCAHNTFIRESI